MRTSYPSPRRHAGFTLIELMIAVAVAGVLSGVAFPSFQGVLHKSRRSEALVALMQAQAAQERWRANHRGYGTLAEIGIGATTPGGHYALQVADVGDDGYDVTAVASGSQSRDAACRYLRLRLDGATVSHASGTDALVANPPAANRRCWLM
jgi:type IV pilus assembly protein PilE